MGSKLAITEKRAPIKSRGFSSVFFFHFFDWNHMMLSKKKKKLFSNSTKLLLPSVSKKFDGDEKMPKSKHLLIGDENNGGFASSHKQRDYLNNQMRDPGPVAKLMGLESMPVIHQKNPSNPSLVSQFNSDRHETSEMKESRPQKLQRTGGFLERRQQQRQPLPSSEILQSNRKLRRQHHHKLASPIKSPRLLSKRSSTRLMEVATKILEPGLQTRKSNARCALTYTSPPRSEETESKDDRIFTRKCNVLMNGSGVGPSRSFRGLDGIMELKLRNEDMLAKENITSSLCSQAKIDAKRPLFNPRAKDVQAKIDIDNRSRALFMQDDHSKTNTTHNQLTPLKGRLVNGSKVNNKPLRRRNLGAPESGLRSCTQARVEGTGLEKKKNKAPKRRPNDDLKSESARVVSFTFDKQQIARRELINGKGKGVGVSSSSIHRSSVKSDCKNGSASSEGNGNGNGNGIVSFTFNSPMRHDSKTRHARKSFSNEDLIEKRRCIHKPNHNFAHPQKSVSKSEVLVGGDSLSALLEKKIMELNSLSDDDYAKTVTIGGRSTASILEELISALKPTEEDASSFGSMNNSDQNVSHGEMVKSNDKLQNEGEADILAAYLGRDDDHPSPMSILEVSFSNDSCFSGSPHISSGHKPDFGFPRTFSNVDPLDFDTDLLDSASSVDTNKFNTEKIADSLLKNSVTQDTHLNEVFFSQCKLNHSTEAMSNAKVLIENISLPNSESDKKDSFFLGTLETITKALKDANQLKSLVSDCMIEWLGSRYNCFLMSRSTKILLLMRGEVLARELCKEIEGWSGLVGLLVDEMVEKDMSSSKGMWTKFEDEACENGVEIGNDILHELVVEMVIDLCI